MRDHASSARLLSMPEAELLQHVTNCPKTELRRIYALGVVCRCEPFSDLYRRVPARKRKRIAALLGISQANSFGLIQANCGDDGVPMRVFVPCQHKPETTLPGNVASVLLARLWPRDYAEPPLDRSPSAAASPRECLELRVDRARRRRRLWHPGDAQQSNVDGLADAFGIRIETDRAGNVSELDRAALADLDGDDYAASERPSERTGGRVRFSDRLIDATRDWSGTQGDS